MIKRIVGKIGDASMASAGAVNHMTARIGDALDAWEHGVLSHVNNSARAKGLREGQPLREAIQRFRQ